MASQECDVLWKHPDPSSTQMWKFIQRVNEKHGMDLSDYRSLYRWSVENVQDFWAEAWLFLEIIAEKAFEISLPPRAPMYPRPDFMAGSTLNFAQNLLFPPSSPKASSPAAITLTELTSLPPPESVVTSWDDLREAVRRCSCALRESGLQPNDVVAGFVSNHVEALVAMLSAASIGALWTGISPDSGVSAVLDRLGQIDPKVLFADNGVVYNGKQWSGEAKIRDVVGKLAERDLKLVVVIDSLVGHEVHLDKSGVEVVKYKEFLGRTPPESPIRFEQLPPSHPLYILYSSGTTGLPKAIIHTALGTLLQHKKELALHCNMTPSSTLLYYTTTSWMMWHWSTSALSVGATLVLYSGSPFKPHSFMSLPRIMSSLKVTHFGTSAAYLTTLEANQIYPARERSVDLSSLEAIYSTASPLPPSTFRFVYEAFPSHVNLASITGGTDIISLFGAPCPLLPVRTGQIQCAGLGMAIKAVDPEGNEVSAGDAGDLVCVKPFPSQPLTFYGLDGDKKYKSAYFERFSDVAGGSGPVWHHGDFVKIPNPNTGSLMMLGRSDGVLKPSGVRFGSAEIYNILTKFFASTVEDSVCIGRRRESDSDEVVCLFLVMQPGHQFDERLCEDIRSKIRTELSPRHVPGVIDECTCASGLPKTTNGKKIEVAVKQILCGMPIQTNASIANPESLDWFRDWASRTT